MEYAGSVCKQRYKGSSDKSYVTAGDLGLTVHKEMRGIKALMRYHLHLLFIVMHEHIHSMEQEKAHTQHMYISPHVRQYGNFLAGCDFIDQPIKMAL